MASNGRNAPDQGDSPKDEQADIHGVAPVFGPVRAEDRGSWFLDPRQPQPPSPPPLSSCPAEGGEGGSMRSIETEGAAQRADRASAQLHIKKRKRPARGKCAGRSLSVPE